uniref:Tic20-like family protein n=1 Tax=Strongyloides papillosus TaxID=174720 RepID=A0A0N5C0K9_STREA
MKRDDNYFELDYPTDDEDKAGGKRGTNIIQVTKIHSPISLIVSIIGILLGIVALLYPELHHQSLIHKELFQNYERIHQHEYRIIYKIICGSWIVIQTIHLVTIILSMFGLKTTKPGFLIPQLIILLFLIGIQILLLSSLILLNIIGEKFDIIPILLTIFFLTFNSTNAYVLLYSYRTLSARWNEIKRILSEAKSVHFKDKIERTKIKH